MSWYFVVRWLGMWLRIVMHDVTLLGSSAGKNYEIIVTYLGKCAMIGVLPELCCPALRGHACPPIPYCCYPLLVSMHCFSMFFGMSTAPLLTHVDRVATWVYVLHMSKEEVPWLFTPLAFVCC